VINSASISAANAINPGDVELLSVHKNDGNAVVRGELSVGPSKSFYVSSTGAVSLKGDLNLGLLDSTGRVGTAGPRVATVRSADNQAEIRIDSGANSHGALVIEAPRTKTARLVFNESKGLQMTFYNDPASDRLILGDATHQPRIGSYTAPVPSKLITLKVGTGDFAMRGNLTVFSTITGARSLTVRSNDNRATMTVKASGTVSTASSYVRLITPTGSANSRIALIQGVKSFALHAESASDMLVLDEGIVTAPLASSYTASNTVRFLTVKRGDGNTYMQGNLSIGVHKSLHINRDNGDTVMKGNLTVGLGPRVGIRTGTLRSEDQEVFMHIHASSGSAMASDATMGLLTPAGQNQDLTMRVGDKGFMLRNYPYHDQLVFDNGTGTQGAAPPSGVLSGTFQMQHMMTDKVCNPDTTSSILGQCGGKAAGTANQCSLVTCEKLCLADTACNFMYFVDAGTDEGRCKKIITCPDSAQNVPLAMAHNKIYKKSAPSLLALRRTSGDLHIIGNVAVAMKAGVGAHNKYSAGYYEPATVTVPSAKTLFIDTNTGDTTIRHNLVVGSSNQRILNAFTGASTTNHSDPPHTAARNDADFLNNFMMNTGGNRKARLQSMDNNATALVRAAVTGHALVQIKGGLFPEMEGDAVIRLAIDSKSPDNAYSPEGWWAEQNLPNFTAAKSFELSREGDAAGVCMTGGACRVDRQFCRKKPTMSHPQCCWDKKWIAIDEGYTHNTQAPTGLRSICESTPNFALGLRNDQQVRLFALTGSTDAAPGGLTLKGNLDVGWDEWTPSGPLAASQHPHYRRSTYGTPDMYLPGAIYHMKVNAVGPNAGNTQLRNSLTIGLDSGQATPDNGARAATLRSSDRSATLKITAQKHPTTGLYHPVGDKGFVALDQGTLMATVSPKVWSTSLEECSAVCNATAACEHFTYCPGDGDKKCNFYTGTTTAATVNTGQSGTPLVNRDCQMYFPTHAGLEVLAPNGRDAFFTLRHEQPGPERARSKDLNWLQIPGGQHAGLALSSATGVSGDGGGTPTAAWGGDFTWLHRGNAGTVIPKTSSCSANAVCTTEGQFCALGSLGASSSSYCCVRAWPAYVKKWTATTATTCEGDQMLVLNDGGYDLLKLSAGEGDLSIKGNLTVGGDWHVKSALDVGAGKWGGDHIMNDHTPYKITGPVKLTIEAPTAAATMQIISTGCPVNPLDLSYCGWAKGSSVAWDTSTVPCSTTECPTLHACELKCQKDTSCTGFRFGSKPETDYAGNRCYLRTTTEALLGVLYVATESLAWTSSGWAWYLNNRDPSCAARQAEASHLAGLSMSASSPDPRSRTSSAGGQRLAPCKSDDIYCIPQPQPIRTAGCGTPLAAPTAKPESVVVAAAESASNTPEKVAAKLTLTSPPAFSQIVGINGYTLEHRSTLSDTVRGLKPLGSSRTTPQGTRVLSLRYTGAGHDHDELLRITPSTAFNTVGYDGDVFLKGSLDVASLFIRKRLIHNDDVHVNGARVGEHGYERGEFDDGRAHKQKEGGSATLGHTYGNANGILEGRLGMYITPGAHFKEKCNGILNQMRWFGPEGGSMSNPNLTLTLY